MSLSISVITLAGVWFLVVTIPGPNFLVVTQFSMSESRKSGLLIALGVSTGAFIWATASLVGLSVIFNHANWLYDTIRILGGMYLIFIGLKTIWSLFSSAKPSFSVSQISNSSLSVFRRGLFTSFSNPKTAAFFGSLFVATFPPQAPPWVYVITVWIIFSISLFWYGLVACFFSIAKVQHLYRKSKPILDTITGSLLSFLGLRLLFARSP
jgi:RhtB (resistance to homoserine/threonine) family protein